MKKTYEVQYRLRKGGRWHPSHGKNFLKSPAEREIQEELSTMVEDLTYYMQNPPQER